MKFQVINVIKHDFKPIKIQNNVVFAKCDCCQRQRIAVYVQNENHRIYFYSGYDEQIAKIHFNFLVKHQNSTSQD